MSADRYLFDPTDARDDRTPSDADDLRRADVRALEERLASRRFRARELDLSEAPENDVDELLRDDFDARVPRDDDRDADDPWDVPAWQRRPRVDPVRTSRLAAACVAALGTLLFLGDMLGWYDAAPEPFADHVAYGDDAYGLEVVAGTVRVEGLAGVETLVLGRDLRPGERVLCDADARALLSVGTLGSVEVRPGSELAIRSAGGDGPWSLFLERGEVRASIFAAPRAFQVGTPSGLAVDLGCMYTARVEDDGATRLLVEGGRVAFETDRRKVLVPAGAETRARPGEPPATPVWSDANAELRAAVARLDALATASTSDDARALDPSDAQALAEVLAVPGKRHTLTLWHLLDHPRRAVRAAVFDDLAVREAPPDGVTREALVDERASALRETWRDELEFAW